MLGERGQGKGSDGEERDAHFDAVVNCIAKYATSPQHAWLAIFVCVVGLPVKAAVKAVQFCIDKNGNFLHANCSLQDVVAHALTVPA